MHALQSILGFFVRSFRWQRESVWTLANLLSEPRRFLKVLITVTTLVSAGAAQAAPVFVVSDTANNLLRVDMTSGAASVIGNTGSVGPFTDLAVSPTGTLWGITFSTLYRINPNTAALTLVGDHGVSAANALAFSSDGTLYMAAGSSASLYTVNTSNGVAAALPGSMGTNSDGDLAFHNGQLYLAGTNGQLVRITLGTTVAGTNVGPFGVPDVYGLTSDSVGRLIAVSGRTFYQTNTSTGALTPLFSYSGFGIALGIAQISTSNFVPVLMYLLDDD